MALIKCSECNREISDKAAVCPNCGCPLTEMVTNNNVKIKLPRTEQISGGWIGLLSSKDVVVSSCNGILWRGKHGETAIFTVDDFTHITINLGFWSNPVSCFVSPRKKYELIQDYGFHLKSTFRLAEVDFIDSGF